MNKFQLILLGAALVGTFSQAHAQLLIDPATVEYSGGGVNFPAVNLINNAGLSSNLSTPGNAIALPTSFPAHDNGYSNTFRSQPNELQTLTFDLNANPATGGNATGYNLTGLYIYAYNESGTGEAGPDTERGLASTDLQYSTDGGMTYTDYGTITFTQATGDPSYTGFQLNLSGTLNQVTNFEFIGGSAFSSDSYYVGLDAVRAIGTTAVPEPSTMMLLLGGGLIVLLIGSRRKSTMVDC
jgi:hypothetical protein